MNEILFCSHNPIVIKNLYGVLRDEGYSVEITDHPALAVQMAFKKNYTAIIIDSEPFGLSAEDAVKIIKTVLPNMPVIFLGNPKLDTIALNVTVAADLEEVKQTIRTIQDCEHNYHLSKKGGL